MYVLFLLGMLKVWKLYFLPLFWLLVKILYNDILSWDSCFVNIVYMYLLRIKLKGNVISYILLWCSVETVYETKFIFTIPSSLVHQPELWWKNKFSDVVQPLLNGLITHHYYLLGQHGCWVSCDAQRPCHHPKCYWSHYKWY